METTEELENKVARLENIISLMKLQIDKPETKFECKIGPSDWFETGIGGWKVNYEYRVKKEPIILGIDDEVKDRSGKMCKITSVENGCIYFTNSSGYASVYTKEYCEILNIIVRPEPKIETYYEVKGKISNALYAFTEKDIDDNFIKTGRSFELPTQE